MPEFGQRRIVLTIHIYDRLTAVKEELEQDKQRQVTYTEAVEYLLTYRESTAHLSGTEAGR